MLEVQRQQKSGKVFTQKQVLEIGLNARRSILKRAQNLGTQTHQAIQAENDGYSYELDPEFQPYFNAYYNWKKNVKLTAILQEEKVYNVVDQYAGRIDFYGELNGKRVLIDFKTSNQVRWTYGLQLCAYKRALEMAGYPVDATYVLHVKPIKRGGQEPCATLHEFNFEYSKFQSLLDIFWLKVYNNDVEWAERTDNEAIKKELANITSSESAPQSNALGHQQDTPDTLPSTFVTADAEPARWSPSYSHLANIPNPAQVASGWIPVPDSPTSHSSSPQGIPVDETSSPQTEIRPGIPPEEVEFVPLTDRNQKPLKTSKPLSGKGISLPPEEIELDTRRLRRLGIDV